MLRVGEKSKFRVIHCAVGPSGGRIAPVPGAAAESVSHDRLISAMDALMDEHELVGISG